MNFVEVTPEQYRNFALNPKILTWGVSDTLGGVTYINVNDDRKYICVGITIPKNKIILVREDYIQYCELTKE